MAVARLIEPKHLRAIFNCAPNHGALVMAHAELSRGAGLDWELGFLGRLSGPVLLLARAMLAYIFILEGYGKISGMPASPATWNSMAFPPLCCRR
jgi:hypothetical protein